MTAKRMLIRADDLGYSEGVNLGIAKSVNEGLIRNIGVMPNMPLAKQGLDLLKRDDLCLGQHTNVCVGRPLSNPADIPSITDENGMFVSSRTYRTADHDFVVLDEVVLEIEAQYQKFKELTGREPEYFEAHAVSSVNLGKGLEIVAQRHNLPLLQFSTTEPVAFRNTRMIVSMESMGPDYDPFESLKRCAQKEYAANECPMFVCHPGYLDWYLLQTSSLTVPRAMEVEMLCSPKTRQWLDEQGIQLVTYNDIH